MTTPNRSISLYLSLRSRQLHLPMAGTFELSPLCNLDCRMCYVRKSPAQVRAHPRPLLTLAQWKQLADEATDAGMLYLLLTGGEPFLWPDFRTLYEYLIPKGLLISINSNGTLIDDATIAWLRQSPPTRINITLYGADDAGYRRLCGRAGMYDRVTQNIDRLLAAGIPVKLNASITPHNRQDLPGIVRFAQERDLLLEVATYMFPPVRREEQGMAEDRFTPEEAAQAQLEYQRLVLPPEAYQAYLHGLSHGQAPPAGLDESCVDPTDGQVRCQAGRGSFWVTWDGYMLPCGMVPSPRVDLVREGFTSAWLHTWQTTEGLRMSGLCQSCENRQLCHACLANAVAETGTPEGVPRYLCHMAEALRRAGE